VIDDMRKEKEKEIRANKKKRQERQNRTAREGGKGSRVKD
jgi:hypothetical protein